VVNARVKTVCGQARTLLHAAATIMGIGGALAPGAATLPEAGTNFHANSKSNAMWIENMTETAPTAAAPKSAPLADLVLAGVGQTEAVPITDFIFMAKDVSNAYLVRTADGDVLINTGTVTGSERTQGLFAPLRSGPLRYIIVTQSHADHYGGIAALRDQVTRVVVEQRFPETRRYYAELQPFFAPRTASQARWLVCRRARACARYFSRWSTNDRVRGAKVRDHLHSRWRDA
jgi:beta-lactamase superfamily II metal-dependent hydrolase